MKNAFMIILFLPSLLLAQTATTTTPDFTNSYYNTFIIGFLILITFIALGFLLWGTEEGKPSETKVKNRKTFVLLKKLNAYITASTPLEKENDILMQDNFDGIRELDNRIPPWFSFLFYGSILFAVLYLLNYQVFRIGYDPYQEYNQEMASAQKQKEVLLRTGALITEETAQFTSNPEALENGKSIFKSNCVACHAPDGGGIVGPNLTDDYWIHGNGIRNIFKTIYNGVPEKGMIAWKTSLTPKQIQDVANYVISLHGTKPANPKKPEGVQVFADSLKPSKS